MSKLLEPSVPNSAFAESGSTPGVFSIVLKLILAHSCWVNDSMKKAKMGQDSLFIDLFLSPGINEISLKGLTIPASLSMQFQLYCFERTFIWVLPQDLLSTALFSGYEVETTGNGI